MEISELRANGGKPKEGKYWFYCRDSFVYGFELGVSIIPIGFEYMLGVEALPRGALQNELTCEWQIKQTLIKCSDKLLFY